MERIAKVTFKILLIGLSLFLLWLTFSCAGSKSKLIQKTQFSTEIAKVERVNELVEKDVEKVTETATGSEKTNENESENFQAEIDDPTRPASIKKKEKEGETVWELDNIKNFNSGKEKSKEQTKDTSSQKQSEIDKSKSSKDTEASTNIDSSGSEKIINKQKDGKFPWWWLILIALSIAIYLWIGKLKKTYMPWKWFTS